MYDVREASCGALKSLTSSGSNINSFYSQGWSGGIPWIYYTGTSASIKKNAGRIQATMSLSKETPSNGKINILKFKLAKYTLEGDFVGYEDLTTQLQLCSSSLEDGVDYRRFGVTMTNACKFDLNQLVSDNLPSEANFFYEMFLEDANGDLIDIPILVENLVGEGRAKPNVNDNDKTWKFVRRFFIFDTLSGLEGKGNYISRVDQPKAVRWISSATLFIELDEGNLE